MSGNTEEVSVKFTADPTQLSKGLKDSERGVADGIARMKQQLASLGDAARSHAGKVTEHFKKAEEGVKSATSGIEGIVGGITSKFLALGATLAAGAMFGKAIDATKELTKETLGLSRVLGITAEQASVLNVALGDVYLSADDMQSAAVGLQRNMRANEQAINAMGVKTRDSKGHFLDLNTVMDSAIKVMASYKEGVDRTGVALEIFGRAGFEAAKLVKLTDEVMAGAREKAESLGLTLTSEGKEAFDKYRASMNDVGDVMTAIKKVIGEAVMPILAKLGEWFASIGPAAVTVIKGAIGGLAATFWYLKNGIVVVWETINAFVVSVAEPLRALGSAFVKLVQGDFKGAQAEMMNWPGNVKKAWDQAMGEIAKSSEETNRRVTALFSKGTPIEKKEAKGKTFAGHQDTKDSIVPQLEAELQEVKVAVAQRNAITREGLSIQAADEAAYWENALQRTGLSEKDKAAIRRKAAEANLKMLQEGFDQEIAMLKREEVEAQNNAQAKLQIAEREAEKMAGWYGRDSKQFEAAEQKRVQAAIAAENQLKQIRLQALNLQRDRALAVIDAEELAAKTQFDLKVITQQQLLALEQQFEARRREIRVQALQDELASVSPDKDPVRYAQLTAQIEQLELQHQQRLREIRAEVSKADAASNPFVGMADATVDAVGQMVDGVLGKFQTLRDTATNVFRQTYAAFVNEMITKPLQQMMMRYLRETILYKLMGQQQVAAQGGASDLIMGKKATEAMAVVGANAAEAGSGAAASQASIPYVGPILAAAAFASIFSMVMGARSSIRSARNGFDIPGGLNPITQLHEREMVLPQEQADAVRDMATGRATVHIHGTPDDTVKLRDLAGLLKKMGRDFVFVS